MIVDYAQVMVVVITENNIEMKNYFRLFKTMLNENIKKCIESKDYCEIDTEKFNLRFRVKNDSLRGCRAHYVLNLTQDKEWNEHFAIPMTTIANLLDSNKWQGLFQ